MQCFSFYESPLERFDLFLNTVHIKQNHTPLTTVNVLVIHSSLMGDCVLLSGLFSSFSAFGDKFKWDLNRAHFLLLNKQCTAICSCGGEILYDVWKWTHLNLTKARLFHMYSDAVTAVLSPKLVHLCNKFKHLFSYTFFSHQKIDYGPYSMSRKKHFMNMIVF